MDAIDDLALSRVLSFLPSPIDLARFARCSKRACEAVQCAEEAWRQVAEGLPPCPSSSGGTGAAAAGRGGEEEEEDDEASAATTRTRAAAASTAPPAATPTTPPKTGCKTGSGRAPGWRPPPACPAARECRRRLAHRRRASLARRALDRLRRESDAAAAERAVRALTLEAAAEERARGALARDAAAIEADLRAADAAAGAAGGGGGSVRAWVPSGVRAGWEAAAAAAATAAAGPSPLSVVAAPQAIDARVRLRQLAQELAASDARAETLAMSLRAARESLTAALRALREAAAADAAAEEEEERRRLEGGGGGGRGIVRVNPTPLVLL